MTGRYLLLMQLCLFEDHGVRRLAPLTLTRHAADLRIGMFTIAEMHRRAFQPRDVWFHARPQVARVTQQEHPDRQVNQIPRDGGLLFVNARFVPARGDLLSQIRAAVDDNQPPRAFWQDDVLIAAWQPQPPRLKPGDFELRNAFESIPEERVEDARLIDRLWDLVDDVEQQIIADFEWWGDRGATGAKIHDGARIAGTDYFLGEGATIMPGAVVNALDGPVYIAEGAVVEENAVVRGPCYVGPRAQIKAAARIDGSAIGPVCKVGGEVHGSVFHSLSGKPHDGYVGNSYLGRWCNLGADTNTSNLKNDYGEVTMFDPVDGDLVRTGRQFLGLIMGDHSKSSINTMFNTGTVVGVSCNLYGADFPPRHVPSFSWGGAHELVEYRLDKALQVAEAVMARRNTPLTEADRNMLETVFEQTQSLRRR